MVEEEIYIFFYVEEDEDFIRDGNDIYIEVPVFFTKCILGGKITIPSLEGELKIDLNRGRGIEKDLYLKIRECEMFIQEREEI